MVCPLPFITLRHRLGIDPINDIGHFRGIPCQARRRFGGLEQTDIIFRFGEPLWPNNFKCLQ